MDFLTYLLTSIISYLGILGGVMLIFIAPEELSPGRKYFRQFFCFMFSLTVFYTIYMSSDNLYAGLGAGIPLYLVMAFFYQKFPLLKYLIYPVLGVLIGISSQAQNFFLLTSALIFLTGLPFGSMSINDYRKKDRIILARRPLIMNLGFFIFAIIFFFV